MKRANEEPQSTAPKKKQASILTMFKPVATPKAEVTKVEKNTASAAVSSKEESTNDSVKRDPKALFKGVPAETLELLDLEINTMNYKWLQVLAKDIQKPSFLKLKRFLKSEKEAGKTIFPPLNQIYSWSNYTPPSEVKVVILGQDPYHNYNQAHGLSFSVVKGVKIPPSLVNMYKELKIEYPDFKVPTHGFLEGWAKQGVLMLNNSLTVEAHKAGSHANQGWEQFTDAVINYINNQKVHVVFMLWGSHAQKKGAKIHTDKHLVLKSVHPSPLSAHRGFFECGHFKSANDYLKEKGKEEINWNCLA